MAGALRSMIEYYRRVYGLPPPEALAQAQAPADPAYLEKIRACPASDLSWLDLEYLTERDPELALRRWEEVKQAASEELRIGHRAAQALEPVQSEPRKRAQFLALCQDLEARWQPRDGVERQLMETMALAQSSMLHWLEKLTLRSTVDSRNPEDEIREHGGWTRPRVSDSQAMEQAMGMVERFNRIFLRTLRALQDLRRRAPSVIVQNAGHVNIGRQQVNMTATGGPGHTSSSEEDPLPCKCHKSDGGVASARARRRTPRRRG